MNNKWCGAARARYTDVTSLVLDEGDSQRALVSAQVSRQRERLTSHVSLLGLHSGVYVTINMFK